MTADREATRDRFFTGQWIGLSAIGVVLGYAVALTWQGLWNSWHLGVDGKYCRDFTWIWLSSKFAAVGALARAYDYSAFAAARAGLVGPPNCIIEHLDYPPTLFLFTRPLGSMPYSVAFALWVAATMSVYLAAVFTILPRPAAVVAALAPYPVFINVLLGHTGFLTAGLLGLSLAALERGPWLSGVFLGFLAYKPPFGILVPFALFASRNWRTFFGATAAGIVLAAAAAIAFGAGTWPAFVAALGDRAASLGADRQLNFWLVSVFGFLRTLGVGGPTAWAAQAAVTTAVALLVSVLWSRPIRYPLKAAALAAGSMLAAPHAFGYDACILTIAAAFIVRDGLAHGFLPREPMLIAACWAGLLILAGPVPAIVCVVLLALVVRRAARCGPHGFAVRPVPLAQGQCR
jgi:hypothetical protein